MKTQQMKPIGEVIKKDNTTQSTIIKVINKDNIQQSIQPEPKIKSFAEKFQQINEIEWQNSTLKKTMQISLQPGPGYLQDFAKDLNEEGTPLVLTNHLTERALYARLTTKSVVTPLRYLIGVLLCLIS
jgi:hypothetical protein